MEPQTFSYISGQVQKKDYERFLYISKFKNKNMCNINVTDIIIAMNPEYIFDNG